MAHQLGRQRAVFGLRPHPRPITRPARPSTVTASRTGHRGASGACLYGSQRPLDDFFGPRGRGGRRLEGAPRMLRTSKSILPHYSNLDQHHRRPSMIFRNSRNECSSRFWTIKRRPKSASGRIGRLCGPFLFFYSRLGLGPSIKRFCIGNGHSGSIPKDL